MARRGRGTQATRRCVWARSLSLTRRRVVAGALGAAGASLASAGLVRPGGGVLDLAALVAAQGGEELCAPHVLERTNGLLSVELVAEDVHTTDGGLAYAGGGVKCPGKGPGFSGRIPGPTLQVKPGDRLKIKLINALNEPTNLHVHGLHVTPLGNGDNVFVHVRPGEEFDFEYDIPPDHPTGVFWYHPHAHTHAQAQVEKGLAGAILIVDDPAEPPDEKTRLILGGARYPGPPEAEERLLIFQRVPSIPGPILINGRANPVITIRGGEKQRWQLLNASATYFVNLFVQEHAMARLAVDGNWIPNYRELDPVQVIALGPAERAEVLITGAAVTADQEFPISSYRTADTWHRPIFDGDLDPPVEGLLPPDRIATLRVVAGGAPTTEATPEATPEPPAEPQERCMRAREEAIREIIIDTAETIDGKEFSEGRVDQTVNYGAVETWRIVSRTGNTNGWHPFHLHVNDFDVLATSDPRLLGANYQDTVPAPPRNGWVEFCSRFEDYAGKFVYHCHFLDHEDAGMMGVVEVVMPVAITAGAIDQPTLTVLPGTTVVWTNLPANEGAAAYTIAAADGSFDSGVIEPGQSYAYTFDAPGDVAYCCLPAGSGAGPATCPAALSGEVKVAAMRTVDITADGGPGTIRFHPPTLQSPPITAGTTVVWTNRDSVPHTVAADGLFSSGPIAPNATFEHTFTTVGELAYAGDVAAPRTPKIDVKPRRPAVTVWIDADGFSHARQALEEHLDEALNTHLYIPPGTLVTWTNRSGQECRIFEGGMETDAAFTSDVLDHEQDPAPDPNNPPHPTDPAMPKIPGQRFSRRFEDLGIVSYRSTGDGTTREGLVYVVAPVEIVDFAFVPETIEIPVGAPVSWVNHGASTHTVTAEDTVYGGVPAYSSEALASGKRFTRTFDAPGVYPYRCAIHEEMRGVVIVREHPPTGAG